MRKSDRVICLGGPGGLRCPCCSGRRRRARYASKRAVRAMVKKHRRSLAMEEFRSWDIDE